MLVLSGLLAAAVAPARAQTALTLDEAMRRARSETAEARALRALTGEADARMRLARANFWPQIDLSETVQRGNQPVFVFGSLLSQRRFTEAGFAIPALNRPDALTNSRTALTVAHTLFDPARTTLAVAAARRETDLVAARRDVEAQDLAFRAAQVFVRVLELEAEVQAITAAVSAAESDQARARARRDVGLVTDADVLALDVHLADMHQRRIAAAGDLAVARLSLANAAGLPLSDAVTPVRPAVPQASPDPDALIHSALAAHPRLREAAAREQLADTSQRIARAAWLPAVRLQGGWESNGATLAAQQSSWLVGAEVRLNLFRGFADVARAAETRHAALRAAAERERVARQIEVEMRAALAHLAAARAAQAAGRTAVAQARESQRIIRDRYDSGLASVTDVLRAAGAALEAESRSAAADMNVILRAVALERALGRL
jgi:outer membrane protein TolC